MGPLQEKQQNPPSDANGKRNGMFGIGFFFSPFVNGLVLSSSQREMRAWFQI